MGSIFSLGISAAAGCNYTSVKVPAWTEYHETTEPQTIFLDSIANVRAEKVSGDGTFTGLKFDQSKASLTLVTTGPSKVCVNVYVITSNPSTQTCEELRRVVIHCVSKHLVAKVGNRDVY